MLVTKMNKRYENENILSIVLLRAKITDEYIQVMHPLQV